MVFNTNIVFLQLYNFFNALLQHIPDTVNPDQSSTTTSRSSSLGRNLIINYKVYKYTSIFSRNIRCTIWRRISGSWWGIFGSSWKEVTQIHCNISNKRKSCYTTYRNFPQEKSKLNSGLMIIFRILLSFIAWNLRIFVYSIRINKMTCYKFNIYIHSECFTKFIYFKNRKYI